MNHSTAHHDQPPPGSPNRFLHPLADYFTRLLDKKPSSGSTLVELDGLRGCAVLLVFVDHANVWPFGETGIVGVWLFFVLSGFLLTRIMLQKMPFSLQVRELAGYAIRRIARIIPAYYTCLALVALIEGKSWDWVFRHYTFRQAEWHFWSIPQEELFYLLLPALCAVPYFLQRWLRLPAVLTAAALAFGLVMGFPFFSIPGNVSTIAFHLNVFIFGFALAHLLNFASLQKFHARPGLVPLANFAGLSSLALILLASNPILALFPGYASHPVTNLGWEHPAAFAAVCTVLLASTLTNGSWLQRFFSWPGLRILGVLSFSLYLVHWCIIGLLQKNAAFQPGLGLFFATLVLSLLVAVLFERFIERPSLRWGRRISARLRHSAGE